MSQPSYDEQVIAAAIEEVLARYAHVIPPGKVDDFRRSFEHALRNHPYPQHLLKRMRPRMEVKQSGTVSTDLGIEAESAAPAGKARAR